jgi:hypothetical protein
MADPMNDTITINGFEYASVAPEGGVQEWANGLPLVGRRELTRGERDELSRRIESSRWKMIWIWPLYIAFFIVSSMFLIVYLQELSFYISLSIFIAFPIIGLFFRDYKRDVYGCSVDLRAGGVRLYKGNGLKLSKQMLYEIAQPQNPIDKGDYIDWAFEALDGSRRVWSINGIRDKHLNPLRPSIYSPIPEELSALTRHIEGSDESVRVRLLTESEKKELLHFRLFSMSEINSILGDVGIVLSWCYCWRFVHFKELQYFFIFSLGIIIGIKILELLCSFYRHKIDIRRGMVCLDESDGITREILPSSKRIWTKNGQPAVWRIMGDALGSSS